MSDQTGSGTSTRRRRLQRSLGVVLGVVLALAIGELIVRGFDLPPRPLPPLAAGFYELSPNRILKYQFRPGVTYQDVQDAGDHLGFHINSAGFRDVEHRPSKPAGCTRVIVLGDSITAGVGVPKLDELFTRRLESLLNKRTGDATYEVINLGVGGYHTLQEAETLRTRGLAYTPDHVLVMFCVNDVSWDADGQVLGDLAELLPRAQQSVLLNGWRSTSWIDAIVSRSRLGFFVFHRFNSLEPVLELEWRRESRSGYVGTPVRPGLAQIQSMADTSGFGCHLFLVPAFDRHFDDYAHLDLHQRIQEQAARFEAITTVDLLDGFADQETPADDLSSDGLHPNARGHDILAGLVYSHIADRVVSRREATP